jgi:hypothetical protein
MISGLVILCIIQNNDFKKTTLLAFNRMRTFAVRYRTSNPHCMVLLLIYGT